MNLTELCHFVKFKYIGIEVLKVNKKEEVIKELGPSGHKVYRNDRIKFKEILSKCIKVKEVQNG